jgi:uncharacterized protein
MIPSITSTSVMARNIDPAYDRQVREWGRKIMFKGKKLAASMLTLKLLVAMVATSLLTSTANADRLDALHGLNHTEHFIHQSPSLGRPFHIYVKVPQNPDRGDKKLPVIYLLDGGETFPIIGAYSHYLTFSEEMPEAIIVGISYGTDDPANGNMRVTDFTAPAAENASYGGAAKFLNMLEREIFPKVERSYPADPDRRTLVGMSLGGQFMLHAATEKPELFEGLIAVNPALHRNLQHFLDALGKMPPTSKSRQGFLYVVSTENDDPRFREPALKWIASAKATKNKPWCLYVDELDDESHLSGLPRAFRNAMRWMHQENPACLP